MTTRPKIKDVKEFWVVEGNFMLRGWEYVGAFKTHGEALHDAKRNVRGLHPIWRYRIRQYTASGNHEAVRYVKGE